MDHRLLLMHQAMIGDRPRLEAYDKALAHAVRAGDVVVDVGAGTLVLSMLALRHGAGHVYAIEADPRMAAVAERIAKHNDLQGRLTLIQGDARVVRLPRKADVLVAEMMGNLGPEEQMVEVLGTVARRNLKSRGRVVPRRLVTHLAALQFDDEGWGVWQEDFFGHRLDVVQECIEPAAQMHFFQRPPTLLSEPTSIATDVIRAGSTSTLRSNLRLPITRAGRLHAIMGYFTADLAPGVTLSNFPSYPGCNWAVWIWPVRHSQVSTGDQLQIEIHRPKAVRDATDWRLDCRISKQRRS